jgi:hypothetical protein
MKIGRRRVQLVVLLLASIVVTGDATDASLPRESLAKNFAAAGSLGEVVAASGGVSKANGNNNKPSPVGTEHAPVDGRDGMPHDGPFVETNAERTRKKNTLKVPDDDDEVIVEKQSYDNHAALPQSNDAVMDDRLRSNPVEGTRGVEGGISEKSKDGKLSADKKKPDPPKDARPLPHGEAETLQLKDPVAGAESNAAVVVDEEQPKRLAVRHSSLSSSDIN